LKSHNSQSSQKGRQTAFGFLQRCISWLGKLGPGIITAAIVFGPSKITITSKLGAQYGYRFLWLVLASIYFMILFTSMATRIGLATKHSLLTIIRQQWGKPVSILTGLSIFLVCASFQAGNSIGVGIAIGELTHTATYKWILLFNIAAIVLLFFRGFYKLLEKIMITLVILMLLSFVLSIFIIRPESNDIASGFIPAVPNGSAGLLIAFVASCFSIVAAFYQSYLTQEKKKNALIEYSTIRHSKTGIMILGLLVIIVMICASAVLHNRGLNVNNAMDMALALEPLFGKYAAGLFLAGLFGASFSSLLGNATVGGTLLSDALGLGSSLDGRITKLLIALIMLIGASFAILFGSIPLQAIVLAQSITIFIVPLAGIALYQVAGRKDIMGKLANNRQQKLMGALGLFILIILAIKNAYDLIN
jgi:Mn2+/Fe2+ NRAMP family transporter